MNRDRIFRFGMMVWQTYGLSKEELLRIVRSKNRYSTRYRAAALRHLVCEAPLSVTGGYPFAERRRRVLRDRRFFCAAARVCRLIP
jgi:hypothetical protein